MAQQSIQTNDRRPSDRRGAGRDVGEMFARIVPRYDLFNTVSTFGQDRRWRALAVQQAAIRPGGGTAFLMRGGREPGRSPSPSPNRRRGPRLSAWTSVRR